jgi:hypothetical protein
MSEDWAAALGALFGGRGLPGGDVTRMKFVHYKLENTKESLVNVHDPEKCWGRPCAIHNRTTHRMRSWPQNFRGDRGIMERMAPLGGGHPDPDDMAWRHDASVQSVHGCTVHPFTGNGVCAEWEWEGSEAAWLYGLPGYAATRDGRIWSWHTDDDANIDWGEAPEEVPYTERKGAHPKSLVIDGGGQWVERFVKNIVWNAWHGQPPKGGKLAHADGDRFNNSVENLVVVA